MDDAVIASHIGAQADAVVRGDMEAIFGGLSQSLRPDGPQLARALRQPTTSADIESVDIGADESILTIRYAGEDSAVTIRTRWRGEQGRPMIVHAEPVG